MERCGGNVYFCAWLSLFGLGSVAHADVVLDGSTGTTGALTGASFQITESLGQRAGANLLHSFSQFSIDQNETAVFSGDASIQNIISRVTGGDITTIDGTLRSTIAGANLFFLNPAGIIVGENAVLDISGALHLSTASELKFADGASLPTTSNAPATLTSASPSAFGFLNTQQGSIQFQGADLNQEQAQFVGISAGSVAFDGADINVPQGMIDIATTTQTADVDIQANAYQIANNALSGDVQIENSSDVIAGAGTIRISSGELTIAQSQLSVSNDSDIDGGRVDIAVSGDVNLIGDDRGRSFNIQFLSDIDDFRNGGAIRAHASSSGNVEGVNIVAGGNVMLSNQFLIASTSLETDATGDAGDVLISSEADVSIDDAVILTDVNGPGMGGDVSIQSLGNILLDDAIIFSRSRSAGNTGNISLLTSQNLMLLDSSVRTNVQFSNIDEVESIRRSGDISIQAVDFFAEDSRVNAGTRANQTGIVTADGEIDVRVNSLMLVGSSISNNAFGRALGADFTIIADEHITLEPFFREVINRTTGEVRFVETERSSISSNASNDLFIQAPEVILNNSSLNWAGSFEDITSPFSFTLNTERLSIEDGGSIFIRTDFVGVQGTIDLNVSESIRISGSESGLSNQSSISTTAGSFSTTGNNAVLRISTRELVLQGNAIINTEGFGLSGATDIEINVDTLSVLDGAGIESSEGIGIGDGRISIQANEAVNIVSIGGTFNQNDDLDTSYIGVEDSGGSIIDSSRDFTSGNIDITTPNLLLDGGEIKTSNFGARANSGSISINVETLQLLNGSQILTENRNADVTGEVSVQASELIHVSGFDSNNFPSRISTRGFSDGNGSDLILTTSSLLVDSGLILASTDSNSDSVGGSSGELVVNAQTVSLVNGGQLLSTVTDATGGSVVVNAQDSVAIIGSRPSFNSGGSIFSGLISATNAGGVGDAGSVVVTTPTLTIEGGLITTESRGSGNAGDITLNTNQLSAIDGSRIISRGRDSGDGGTILISGDDAILNDSRISVESSNQGDAGDINISLSASLRLENNAGIRARANVNDDAQQIVSLNGGNINLIVNDLISLNESEISTLVDAGMGNGGDVFIDPVFVILNNSIIVADAQGGNGGNIDLISDFFFNLDSVLSASSALGVAGQISIVAPEVNLTSQLAIQSADFFNDRDILIKGCNKYQKDEQGELSVRPVNGVAEKPAVLLY